MNYTPRQLQILRMVRQYQQKHGYSPTYAELAKKLKVSTVTVFEHLEALERKGAVSRRLYEARSVEITDPDLLPAHKRRPGIPVRGLLAAGVPIQSAPAGPAEELSFESVFGPRRNTYLLRVRGNSLAADHILEGDLLVVEARDKPREGELVVALDDQGRASLKRCSSENGKVRLRPFNPAAPAVGSERLRVHGIVHALVRKARAEPRVQASPKSKT
jgi:repressor LexA